MRPLGALLPAPRPRAESPVPFVTRSIGSGLVKAGAPPTGMTVQLGQMSATGTLFAIVDRTATAVAATTWHLYRTAKRKADRVEMQRHPALTVWNKPNPYYTRPELIEAWVQHYQLTGEMWGVLPRSELFPDGPPIEIWPVRPDRMRPVPHPTEFISGYVYGWGRDEVPLETDKVMRTKRQSPMDPYRGISPMGSLTLEIYGERAAAEYNAAFFRNGAEPGGIIQVPNELDDRQFRQLTERWREQHQGVQNAHRVAVVEFGEYKQLTYTRKDMQFIELRKFDRDAMRQAYAFPKPILGDVDDINRANAEAAEAVFARWVVNPINDRIREMLNYGFLPLFGTFGQGFEFDYDTAVPESREDTRADRGSKVSAVAQLVAAGFEPEETLKVMELPAIPWVGKPDGIEPPAPAEEPAPAPEPAPKPKPAPAPSEDDDEEEDDGA